MGSLINRVMVCVPTLWFLLRLRRPTKRRKQESAPSASLSPLEIRPSAVPVATRLLPEPPREATFWRSLSV